MREHLRDTRPQRASSRGWAAARWRRDKAPRQGLESRPGERAALPRRHLSGAYHHSLISIARMNGAGV
jgi:hypothetical protein